jgi:hypothetical protein
MDRPLSETERRPEMAKSFTSKRTSDGLAAKDRTTVYLRDSLQELDKRCGRHSGEAWKVRVILAAIHCAAGDYEPVVQLITPYVLVEKGKDGTNPMWMFWALSLLFEAYVNLNRIPEAVRISSEGRSIAKKTDASAKDPLLEALVQRAMALEADRESESRQCGFVVALLTLCWYVSHGFEGLRANAYVKDQLRSLFEAYGIRRGDEWEWTVKHAHLTRYDFVGLLSILLHHTGLAPRPLNVVAKRRSQPRIIDVR